MSLTDNADRPSPAWIGYLKAILWAAAIIWFFRQLSGVLLLFAMAAIAGLALNAPVEALVKRGLSRAWACLAVLGAMAVVALLAAWLVLPRLADQGASLLRTMPDYVTSLRVRLEEALAQFPALQEKVNNFNPNLSDFMPEARAALLGVGAVALSAAEIVVVALLLISTTFYGVLYPRPLVRSYIGAFPPNKRLAAGRALSMASEGIVAWVWSNVVIGAMEAFLVTVACYWIGVPGALVWGLLGFFAELIPRIGLYVMAVPPLIVALAVDPIKALWLLLFFVALNELLRHFVAAAVRGKSMHVHPASLLFAVLALGVAFGLVGAILAMPITAILKAFHDEFFVGAQRMSEEDHAVIERVLQRKTV